MRHDGDGIDVSFMLAANIKSKTNVHRCVTVTISGSMDTAVDVSSFGTFLPEMSTTTTYQASTFVNSHTLRPYTQRE